MDDYVVYECDILIVDSCFLCMVLRRFFSTLVSVLTSATIGGTKKYVLMGFKVLPLTIFSITGALSKSYD